MTPAAPGLRTVVGLGDAGVEIVLHVPRMPGSDEKVFTTRIERHPGGVIANTLCALARLGTSARFLGCVGNDEFGSLVRHSLSAFQVDLATLLVRDGEDTFFCVNLLDPKGEKSLIVVETTTMFPSPADITDQTLAGAALLHTTGLRADTAVKAMTLARARGMQVSLDLEPSTLRQGPDRMRALLAGTDLVFVNRYALREIAGGAAAEAAAATILQWGPRMVVLTRGSEGSTILTAAERLHVPAFTVPVRDTTGAGDCYSGAFIHGYLRGWPLERIAWFATAAAAISIMAVGSQSALPTEAQVRAFLDQARKA